MSFRPAVPADSHQLWRWRLEDERQPWYQGRPTTWETHQAWFAQNKDRIRIWRHVGAVRIESDGTVHLTGRLSFEMVQAVAELAVVHGGRLKAVLDPEDRERVALLRGAGFREFPVKFLVYRT